jgi:flagellar basal body rod protein FlgG
MDAFTIASIGMQGDLRRMDSISQNLANVSTPGYKQEIAVTRSFDRHLQETALHDAAVSTVSALFTVAHDMRAGTLHQTGDPLDIAIDGDGYFEVATDTGLAYSRQGTLRTDARGRLTTLQGYPVMGKGGELVVTPGQVSIDSNGEIRQGERVIGQLKLVRFTNPSAMVALGNSLYGQGGARVAEGEIGGTIKVGYQENSNVNSPQEMVKLTETVRHFEAMQKIMQGYDDAYEKTLQKLGNF